MMVASPEHASINAKNPHEPHSSPGFTVKTTAVRNRDHIRKVCSVSDPICAVGAPVDFDAGHNRSRVLQAARRMREPKRQSGVSFVVHTSLN